METYEELKQLPIEEIKKKLEYKRARIRAVWDKMDSRTKEYDKLLHDIDLICYVIQKHEEFEQSET